jgi:hypothetical protein
MEIIKKITNFLSHPFVQLVGGSGVITVITWLVAHVTKEPPLFTWVAIVVVVSMLCTVLMVNQIRKMLAEQQKNEIRKAQEEDRNKLTKLSDQELEDTIRRWVNRPTLTYHLEPTKPGFLFHFLVRDNTGEPCNIMRSAKDPSFIQLESGLELEPGIAVLSAQEKLKVAGKIRLELARMGIQFEFTGVKHPLDTVRLVEMVPLVDSLTDYNFMQRIGFVMRALILTREATTDALNEIGPKQSPPLQPKEPGK